MKKLSMRKIDLGAGYFRYEVIEDDKVIAKRVSNRTYVAAFIEKPVSGSLDHDRTYAIDKMFGRLDLFAKAKLKTPSTSLYAIAELSQ